MAIHRGAGPDGGRDDCWLLVSDVDDTLVGDAPALRAFVAGVADRRRLKVALNSSRPLASVHATLAALPVALDPDALVGAMGTEVEIAGTGERAWQDRFAGWRRESVDRVMAKLGFAPHADEFQTPLKASFAVPREHWERTAAAVRAAGVRARIVTSGESDFDVLPEGSGKAPAALFVARRFGVPPDRIVVAGDSANDLALFEVTRKGIVVGNAREELRAAVRGRAYLARAERALGVLEGLRHYGVPVGPSTMEESV